MGDTFHQTKTEQTATNQQIGISARDVGGNLITVGHGAVASGGTLQIQSLDPKALDVAGVAVHDAIASNAAASQSAMQAYQQALSIVGEVAQNNSTAQSGSVLGKVGVNPSTIIWAVGGAVALVILVGALRK